MKAEVMFGLRGSEQVGGIKAIEHVKDSCVCSLSRSFVHVTSSCPSSQRSDTCSLTRLTCSSYLYPSPTRACGESPSLQALKPLTEKIRSLLLGYLPKLKHPVREYSVQTFCLPLPPPSSSSHTPRRDKHFMPGVLTQVCRQRSSLTNGLLPDTLPRLRSPFFDQVSKIAHGSSQARAVRDDLLEEAIRTSKTPMSGLLQRRILKLLRAPQLLQLLTVSSPDSLHEDLLSRRGLQPQLRAVSRRLPVSPLQSVDLTLMSACRSSSVPLGCARWTS